jgi:hypothetical protein
MYKYKTNSVLRLIVPLLVLSISFFSNGCKKHKPKPETPPNPEVPGPGASDPEEEQKPEQKLVPLKITYKGVTYDFTYLENTEKIAEIKLSTGYKWLFTHKPEKLVFWIELYRANNLYAEIDYKFNDKGQGTTANTFLYDNRVYTPSNRYQFEYNDSNQLSKINLNNVGNESINEKVLIYTSNTIKITTSSSGKITEELQYTCDDKNGIFKNIPYVNLMSTYFDQIFFQCYSTNVLSISDADQNTTHITYEYNKDNYPAKATITAGKTTEQMIITYKAL